MTHDEHYESWKRQRTRVEVPANFADRVLDAVRAYEQRPLRRLVRWLWALAASRPGRVGICTLAVLLFAVRVVSVLAIFLTGLPAEGGNVP
jgi:hypothetical protein